MLERLRRRLGKNRESKRLFWVYFFCIKDLVYLKKKTNKGRYFLYLLFRLIRLGGNIKKLQWEEVHQKFELNFHRHENYRWDNNKFLNQWTNIFSNFMKLTPGSFAADEIILDVGCGSRPAIDWFSKSLCQKYYIDPLLDSYRNIAEVQKFWEDKKPHSLLALPAEHYIEFLVNKCGFIICWNVLDHSYDWRIILHNITQYCKEGGAVCIGTDFESHGKGHPGIDDKGYFLSFIKEYYRINEKRENYFGRELALSLQRNKTI